MMRKFVVLNLVFCVAVVIIFNLVNSVHAYGGSETPSAPIIPDTAAEAAEKEDRLSRILFPHGEQNRLRLLREFNKNPTTTISYSPSPRDSNVVRGSTACHRQQGTGGLVAKCTFTTPRASTVRGTLTLTQTDVDGPTSITGKITGLPGAQGERGFHIHELGDFSRDCASALGHFNPFNKTHGGPNSPATERHVGDLGNISVDGKGVANVQIVDKLVSLFGRFSVVGRAIVIHNGRDDLGEGDFKDSLRDGHSGPRVACCAIVYARAAVEIPPS